VQRGPSPSPLLYFPLGRSFTIFLLGQAKFSSLFLLRNQETSLLPRDYLLPETPPFPFMLLFPPFLNPLWNPLPPPPMGPRRPPPFSWNFGFFFPQSLALLHFLGHGLAWGPFPRQRCPLWNPPLPLQELPMPGLLPKYLPPPSLVPSFLFGWDPLSFLDFIFFPVTFLTPLPQAFPFSYSTSIPWRFQSLFYEGSFPPPLFRPVKETIPASLSTHPEPTKQVFFLFTPQEFLLPLWL